MNSTIHHSYFSDQAQRSSSRTDEKPDTLREEQNIFLAMENELYAHDPALAKILRQRATPSMTKRLADIEKSGQALENSLKELEESYQDHLNMAKEGDGPVSSDKVMIRLGKLEEMMANTRQSLELNRTTRDDLVQWLLGQPLPAAMRSRG